MSRQNRNTKNSKKSAKFHGGGEGLKSRGSDAKPLERSKSAKPGRKSRAGKPPAAKGWIWGQHAVMAALENPARNVLELRAAPKTAERLKLDALGHKYEQTSPADLDRFLPEGASHQGLALRAAPLKDTNLHALAAPAEGLLLVLDQVTDPHNVGAMFRLASAFGARGIIMQDRHAPPLAGATAKVAVGALERVPFALVTNIANSLEALREAGWMVTGLAGEATLTLAQALVLPKNATEPANVIVMGAEGPGLRPRVRDHCDQLAKIPMPGGAESLNVATAAAIALYEASQTA